jgi:hypothetical protein
VNGCCHIKVFIAGAITIGLEKSQARTMQVYVFHWEKELEENLTRRLSDNPFPIFASVFADNGAIINISAHLRSFEGYIIQTAC